MTMEVVRNWRATWKNALCFVSRSSSLLRRALCLAILLFPWFPLLPLPIYENNKKKKVDTLVSKHLFHNMAKILIHTNLRKDILNSFSNWTPLSTTPKGLTLGSRMRFKFRWVQTLYPAARR